MSEVVNQVVKRVGIKLSNVVYKLSNAVTELSSMVIELFNVTTMLSTIYVLHTKLFFTGLLSNNSLSIRTDLKEPCFDELICRSYCLFLSPRQERRLIEYTQEGGGGLVTSLKGEGAHDKRKIRNIC